MKTVHLGHHFFGAGNLGDDFMLAGFLAAVPKDRRVAFTCCVPHERRPLARRFPEVEWLPYDEASRREAVGGCDAWLGLGGSPFQSAISSWFLDHLAEEVRFCREAAKPMFLLGVGGQDADAYERPAARALLERAERVWTRDPGTAERAARAGGGPRVKPGADLAHILLAAAPPSPACSGRLTATLNFDYGAWPALPAAAARLRELGASEHLWLAQESRPLPGAERALFEALPADERRHWKLRIADTGSTSAVQTLAEWPAGEWTFSGRYHAALVGAWAGSKGVLLAINEKLAAAAAELGWPSLRPDEPAERILERFASGSPVPRSVLMGRAQAARASASEFFSLI
ncbi:MAG: hypothetical protein ACREFX_06720 [Opitutaceae bacterium]